MLEFTYQNVFFTLFFGLVAMSGLQWADGQDIHSWQKTFLCLAIAIGCMAAAGFAQTDYGAIGVACIIVLYRFRGKKRTQILVGMAVFLWELTAPLAFVPIYYYNQKRGWNLRYFFYFFYPAHLLLLYLLCVALGIASYPAM